MTLRARTPVPALVAALALGACARAEPEWRGPGWPFLPVDARLASEPRFRAALEACARRLDASGRRVEQALGLPADARGHAYRFQVGDGDWRARTVVGADGRAAIRLDAVVLAARLAAPEELLTHELTHAALLRALGPRHDDLPPWLVEALPVHVAGQTDAKLRRALNWADDDIRERLAARFDGPEHEGADLGVDGLAMEILRAKAGEDAVSRLARSLAEGAAWTDAILALTGLSREAFAAEVRALASREMARLEAPHADRVAGARRAEDPARVLELLAPVLADGEHALWPAAVFLAAPHLVDAGRAGEAADLLDALLERRRSDVERLDEVMTAAASAHCAAGDADGARRRCADLAGLLPRAAEGCGCADGFTRSSLSRATRPRGVPWQAGSLAAWTRATRSGSG